MARRGGNARPRRRAWASPRTPTPPSAGSPDTTPRAQRQRGRTLRPLGAFGAMNAGVYDLSGNVWEWTNSCFVRYAVESLGREGPSPRLRRARRRGRAPHLHHRLHPRRARRRLLVGKPPAHLGVRLVDQGQTARRSSPDLGTSHAEASHGCDSGTDRHEECWLTTSCVAGRMTVGVFIRWRMKCVGCPFGVFHSIEHACEEHVLESQ